MRLLELLEAFRGIRIATRCYDPTFGPVLTKGWLLQFLDARPLLRMRMASTYDLVVLKAVARTLDPGLSTLLQNNFNLRRSAVTLKNLRCAEGGCI